MIKNSKFCRCFTYLGCLIEKNKMSMFHHYLSYVFNCSVLILIDSGEAPADGDKASTENSKKRKLKTPIQVMALENFYNGNYGFVICVCYFMPICICFTGVICFFLQSISIQPKK